MGERKRFENQSLDSKDYQKTETGANVARIGLGTAIAAGGAAIIGVAKKFGPTIVKGIGKGISAALKR